MTTSARSAAVRTSPPLERAVSDALDELNCRHYGRVSGWVYPVEFLEFLAEEGHTVTPTTELTELRAEVARLRAGESEHPAAEGTHHTPAQWIHRWNRATADERLAKVEQIFNDSVTATRCWYQDHDTVLQELGNTRQTINRVREFADQIANGSRTVSREFVAQGLLKIVNGETT